VRIAAGMAYASPRAIVRIVLIVVAVAAALYLIYLLRTPLSWLFMAAFVAIALSGPVNWLDRRMPRGLAIAAVYLALFAAPVLLGALVIPPLVEQANELVDEAPQYAQDVQEWVNENESLRNLNEDYDITGKLQEEAAKLPNKIGDAAGVLRDIGFGLVNSMFVLFTILILSAFMLGGGRRWIDSALALQPPERAVRLRRVADHIRDAVANYVAGAVLIAVIAGVLAFIVMTILGVPFKAPLAVIVGAFSLVPLVGATIAAVIVGIVTLFTNFPTATIVWVIWAIAYQQFENYLIQPQIQKRTVQLNPFVVLVSVLFGSTLLGVVGAIIAIPLAAAVQISIREWWAYRMELREQEPPAPKPPGVEAPPPEAAEAPG
jgi:predicted PurR-regulated permease PerM